MDKWIKDEELRRAGPGRPGPPLRFGAAQEAAATVADGRGRAIVLVRAGLRWSADGIGLGALASVGVLLLACWLCLTRADCRRGRGAFGIVVRSPLTFPEIAEQVRHGGQRG